MKGDRWDMEGGMEHMGPPIRVLSFQPQPAVGGVGVGYNILYAQMYGPTLSAFAATQALNNAVWERAEIENNRARKEND